MKQLIILRHAKTERDHPDGDRARQLTKRGKRDSRAAARALLDAAGMPDAILSSPATRAMQTADLVAHEIDYEGQIETVADIYMGGLDELVRVVHALPVGTSTILLVGHNPGFLDLVNWYLGDAAPRDHLPTAAFAVATAAVDQWDQLVPDQCTVSPVVAP